MDCRRFVLVSIVLFTLASVLCGMAQSMLQLVLARALQGIAGACWWDRICLCA